MSLMSDLNARHEPCRPIRFFHRGRLICVDGSPTTRTVLEWLREDAQACGTKEGCAEGDCGACTVMVAELADPADAGSAHKTAAEDLDTTRVGPLRLRTVNSCIRFLPTLDGKALITVEDLSPHASSSKPGNGHSTLHPAQQALVSCHGSQCGFCTPGFVMSLAATYEQHCERGTRPTREALADSVAGNLCRCTGYRPIVDAGEAMFDLPTQRLDVARIAQQLQTLRNDPPLHYHAAHPAFSGRIDRFIAPRTVQALARWRAQLPQARLLAGATDIGLWVNKQFRDVGDLIYLGEVQSLRTIEVTDGMLRIGAAASLQEAWSALVRHWPTLAEVAQRFAGPAVRHAGTLGGNIANGSPIGDGAPVLMALNAQVVLRRAEGSRVLPLDEFYLDYMKNHMGPDEFIEALWVPLDASAQVRAYKISKRFDSDISAVCAGLSVTLADGQVQTVRFAFGGMAAIVKRATAAERAVMGQPWSEATVSAAMAALAQDFTPMSDLRASAAYRLETAQALLHRFWRETAADHKLSGAREVAQETTPAPAPSRPTPSVRTPLGQALAHESAMLHVQGAAPYTDDLPERAGTLHMALVLSPVAHGVLRPIPKDTWARLPGVVAVITAQDIPGENDCGPIVHDDPILASELVQYVGQPVAAIVATRRDLARRAAAQARKSLEIEPLPAVLDMRQAHAQQRYVVPPLHMVRESSPGALKKAMEAAAHRHRGSFSLGGQEQFYLEGQIAYAIPLEDRAMQVICSTQHPSEMQTIVARALGLTSHRVQVECRRMGGGFGGKESQSGLFAAAASVAAQQLQRPVKLRLDRDDDFMITGRRHPFEFDYEVGFDDQGRILAVEITMLANAGFSTDLSVPVLTRALCHFDNAYWLPEVAIHGYLAKTHTQSNTAFRGFGGPQGALAMEVILDDVARRLGHDGLAVRQANFYGQHERNITPYGQTVTDNVIAPLTDALVRSSRYTERRAAVEAFNAHSPIVKRGLAITPVKFGISFNLPHLNQAGALVHVYADGSVLVNHGGTEMGQGLNTKVAQVVAHELGVPLSCVRCTATDTTKVANTSATAASTGIDLNGKAAQAAARQVRDRLATLFAQRHAVSADEVRFENGTVQCGPHEMRFEALAALAYTSRIQLWSDGYYATPGLHWNAKTLQGHPFYYYAYGAAVSEVEVDTQSGESRVLRADLLHDVGRSLNPAIDIGQIEGGFMQGMGWLTTEELVWHPQTGALLTHAPSTYKIPTAHDTPPVLNVALFENENAEDSIHRSKAVGEPPLLLSFSVFLALRDAAASAGPSRCLPILSAPATPESVLRAVKSVR